VRSNWFSNSMVSFQRRAQLLNNIVEYTIVAWQNREWRAPSPRSSPNDIIHIYRITYFRTIPPPLPVDYLSPWNQGMLSVVLQFFCLLCVHTFEPASTKSRGWRILLVTALIARECQILVRSTQISVAERHCFCHRLE
jgi:hypothetical protein